MRPDDEEVLPRYVRTFEPSGVHARRYLLHPLSGISTRIEAGIFAVTAEIYAELTHLPGEVGACTCDNKNQLVLEVQQEGWDWQTYVAEVARMQVDHARFISEYNGNRRMTVGLNDISIIALAKALSLPLVSMESRVSDPASQKRRIPNICDDEAIQHLAFNDLLRREKIKL